MAVRLSIGANRRQLVGQLLLESPVLAMIGGLLGIVVSRWTLDFIFSVLPAEAAPMLDFALDGAVVWFCLGLAFATAFLFGLFPALHSTRPSLLATLKDDAGQKGASHGARNFRLALATMQIALSMALLAAAGLFMRSLVNVSRVELGVRTENVTASLVPMLGGSNWGSSLSVQGFGAGPDTDTEAFCNEVAPGYFTTLGIPQLTGRDFTRADVLTTATVAIVNESFAKKFNLGGDVVGRRMSRNGGAEAALDVEIIGLVKDAKYSEVKTMSR